ncbi:hypothetical protein EVA_21755 [gut metagenome]|uniref:Uncharacterized protein n=1 Tax=gut metagenome TaxID=749906 RepID=J9F6P5_9ZZZZ
MGAGGRGFESRYPDKIRDIENEALSFISCLFSFLYCCKIIKKRFSRF